MGLAFFEFVSLSGVFHVHLSLLCSTSVVDYSNRIRDLADGVSDIPRSTRRSNRR